MDSRIAISCDSRHKRRRRRSFSRKRIFAVVVFLVAIFGIINSIPKTIAAPETITTPELTITIDDTSPMTIDLQPGVSGRTRDQKIYISTTSAAGYKFSIETKGYTYTPATGPEQTLATTDLVNVAEPTLTAKRIPTLNSPTVFEQLSNAYGFYYEFPIGNGPPIEMYLPVPAAGSPYEIRETYSATTDPAYPDSCLLRFGAMANSSIPPGTYQNNFELKVVAKVVPYSVVFNANGGEITGSTETSYTQSIEPGTPTSLIANRFTRADHTFYGWNTAADGSGTFYPADYNTGNGEVEGASAGATVNLYAIWAEDCAPNNICYKDNGANSTTTMGNQSTSATQVNLWPSNFQRVGYGFAGWSEDRYASTKILDSDTTNDPKIYGPMETFTTPTSLATEGVNLYAVWIPSAGSLQNWTGCESLSSGAVTALTDSRDNNTYAVAKLADGNCWFIENMRLGGSAMLNLTSDDSDILANYALLASTNSATMNATNTLSPVTNMTTPTNANIYSYGNYYNWTTATGGVSMTSGNAATSICPKGWKLPTSYNASTNDSLNALDVALGGTGANQTSTAGSNQSAKWRAYPNNYYYAGSYTTGIADRGTAFRSWSSYSVDGSRAYYLSINVSTLNPSAITTNGKTFGLTVRCMARDHYTISYNNNGGSGVMEDQPGFVDSPIKLSVNTFTAPTGKYFNGWNTKADGTGTTYMENENVTNLTGVNETITLYAQWATNIKSISTMQEITPELCTNTAIGISATLRDTRDNKLYTIKKLADGQCWMTSNLRLGDNAITLTPNDTDIFANFDLPAAQTTNGSWGTYNNVTDNQQVRLYSNGDKWLSGDFGSYNMTVETTGTPDSESRYIGSYYNWYTATAGTGLVNNLTRKTQVSICPKGWRLPSGSTDGDFQNLYLAYNSVASDFRAEGAWPLSGQFNGNTASQQSAYGYFWSNTPLNGYSGSQFSAYINYINGSSVSPAYSNNSYKFFGYSIRCIARESYTVAFEPNGGSGSMPNQTIYRDVSTKLSPMNFAPPSGKVFSGWNTASDGTGTSYNDEAGVTNLGVNGSVVPLYAQWKDPNPLELLSNLQDMTSAVCNSAQVGDSAILTDSRDGKKYSIAKLADGKCWMTSNLKLGDSALVLTPNDSDVSTDFALPAAETTTSSLGGYNNASYADIIRNYSSGDWWVSGNFSSTMAFEPMGYPDSLPRYIGNYYNWYTATAGTGLYNNTTTEAPSSICPKGWRLPTGGANSDFTTLYAAYSNNAANFKNAGLWTFGGYYAYSGTTTSQGSVGYFWSSRPTTTAYNSYYLSVNSSSVNYSNASTYKAQAQSVRCVVRDNYTVSFNANGGSGDMPNQTINTGVPTKLSANTFTNSPKSFTGWNTKPDGTGDSYTNEQEVTDLVGKGETITLYAQWAEPTPLEQISTMQEMTSGICSATPVGTEAALKDTRDGKTYSVAKLKDGNCWMTEDLDHDIDATKTYTPADTDISSNWTPDVSTINIQGLNVGENVSGWVGAFGDNGLASADPGEVYWDGSTSRHSRIGNYYNWTAALAVNDSGAYSNGTETDPSQNPQTSICPKGWRLPIIANENTGYVDEFKELNRLYNNGLNSTDSGLIASPLYFTRGGVVDQSSELQSVGDAGSYWSSTAGGPMYVFNTAYYFNHNAGYNDSYSSNIAFGYNIRCVARQSYTVSFNANSGFGNMADQIIARGISAKLKANEFSAPSGFVFDGWNTEANGSGTSYTNEATVTNLADAGGTIILYAQWKDTRTGFDRMMTMQDMTSAICAEAAVGDTKRLRDTRDDKYYNIRKMEDGKCWMVQNLALTSPNGYMLTPADSDVSSEFIIEPGVINSTGETWRDEYEDKKHIFDAGNTWIEPTSAGSNANVKTTGTPPNEGQYIGAYYSYYTATAGTGPRSLESGDAPSSICPKGWKLPTSGTTTSDWAGLTGALVGITSNTTSASAQSFALQNAPAYLGMFGLFDAGSMGVLNQGSETYYMSSSASAMDAFYALRLGPKRIDPGNMTGVKRSGNVVRCVAR